MLTYFPKPFPDESLYSLIGRYHLHTCSKSIYTTKASFLGNESTYYSHCFATHLDQISEMTCAILGLSSQQILMEHTLWPYFFNFFDTKMIDSLLPLIKANTKNIKIKRGLVGLEKGIFPKYCPLCIQENSQHNVEIYWNRIHQIPGIKICHIHNCFLEEIEISSHKHSPSHTIFPPQIELCSETKPKFNQSTLLFDIAKKCQRLTRSEEKIDLDFKKRLIEIGFSTGNHTFVLRLLDHIASFYQKLNHDTYSDFKFVTSAFIGGYKLRTLTYPIVLFDHFISCQPKSPLKIPFWDIQYFGKGPWQCHSTSCLNYKKSVIKNGKFKYLRRKGRTIGRFNCDYCGTTYALSYQIIEGKIAQSFLSIGPRYFKRIVRPSKIIIQSKRELFWKLNSDIGKGQKVRNERQQITRWIKKNDFHWYQAQREELKKLKSRITIERKNLEDEKIFIKIKACVNAMRKKNPRFRVSRTNIARRIGIDPVQLTKDMKDFLLSSEETIDQYRMRRLKRRFEFLKDSGLVVNRTNLIKYFHQSEKGKLENAIERLLGEKTSPSSKVAKTEILQNTESLLLVFSTKRNSSSLEVGR